MNVDREWWFKKRMHKRKKKDDSRVVYNTTKKKWWERGGFHHSEKKDDSRVVYNTTKRKWLEREDFTKGQKKFYKDRNYYKGFRYGAKKWYTDAEVFLKYPKPWERVYKKIPKKYYWHKQKYIQVGVFRFRGARRPIAYNFLKVILRRSHQWFKNFRFWFQWRGILLMKFQLWKYLWKKNFFKDDFFFLKKKIDRRAILKWFSIKSRGFQYSTKAYVFNRKRQPRELVWRSLYFVNANLSKIGWNLFRIRWVLKRPTRARYIIFWHKMRKQKWKLSNFRLVYRFIYNILQNYFSSGLLYFILIFFLNFSYKILFVAKYNEYK